MEIDHAKIQGNSFVTRLPLYKDIGSTTKGFKWMGYWAKDTTSALSDVTVMSFFHSDKTTYPFICNYTNKSDSDSYKVSVRYKKGTSSALPEHVLGGHGYAGLSVNSCNDAGWDDSSCP